MRSGPCGRESRGEGRHGRRVRGGTGLARGVFQRRPGKQAERRWPGACVRAAGTRPRAYWHEVEDMGGVGLGWLQC